MIITVTMNPALDKTAEVDALTRGALNRVRRMTLDAGGKGVNVSKTIRALGGKSIAVGFLAGSIGSALEKMLTDGGIACDFIRVAGEIRTNTKVVEADGTLTELNDPGPQITEEDLQALLKKLDGYAAKDTLFVLSGSVPAGAGTDCYARMIRRVRTKGAKVLLDADGQLLANALKEIPDMIKPNRAELEGYAGKRLKEEELWRTTDCLRSQGIEQIAVSLDSQGALFQFGDYRAACPALPVQVRSSVGAGDAMAAAMALSWEQGLDKEKTVRLCMAASAGAVTTRGTRPPSLETVRELFHQVTII